MTLVFVLVAYFVGFALGGLLQEWTPLWGPRGVYESWSLRLRR